ncbi:hypothetical protein [Ramlibacter albus]|uniref:Uncharacterized protein n=1 Tax=Ramlibacter albus TaxID=2079448 RepID=A0A923M7R3_9BURK|nr:hypothetical protein [Ramlibacter albus]MBC5764443.1 hypothetical protein [Ramlibacter albus]
MTVPASSSRPAATHAAHGAPAAASAAAAAAAPQPQPEAAPVAEEAVQDAGSKPSLAATANLSRHATHLNTGYFRNLQVPAARPAPAAHESAEADEQPHLVRTPSQALDAAAAALQHNEED